MQAASPAGFGALGAPGGGEFLATIFLPPSLIFISIKIDMKMFPRVKQLPFLHPSPSAAPGRLVLSDVPPHDSEGLWGAPLDFPGAGSRLGGGASGVHPPSSAHSPALRLQLCPLWLMVYCGRPVSVLPSQPLPFLYHIPLPLELMADILVPGCFVSRVVLSNSLSHSQWSAQFLLALLIHVSCGYHATS